ncbi:LTA synthase family protein [uncultured Marivita sp.]|uniref:LTA synthase family protein n=1 Tax=uncultured Marivita sp. TaxID=888080 RepID=UPI00261DDD37|nr:LTA synthase family protein [uncultured Marivita sp.]
MPIWIFFGGKLSYSNALIQKLFGALKSYPIWFWGVLSIALLHRVFAIGHYGKHAFSRTYATGGIPNALRMWMEFYGESTLLGVTYDVVFSAIVAVPLVFMPLWLSLSALFCLSIFFAANFDHIKFNHDNINFSTANVGADFTFIKGMINQELILTSIALFAFGMAFVLTQRKRFARRFLTTGTILAIPIALMAPLKGSFVNPLWLQSNPFLGSPLRASAENANREFSAEALLPKSITMETVPKYNVLLVYMEGLSQHSIQIGDMEFLKSLAQENVSFTRYVGHQLITANGLYGSLTGDFPYLARRGFKWSSTDADSEAMLAALPNVLRAQGYETSFLQSALLSFMSKGEVMPRFGFDTVMGRNSWASYYSEDGWGIDDRALFEHSIDYIDTLSKDEKWFVSILTTGTHALYNVPPDYLANETSDRYRSLRYLDDAIRGLMISLEERGLLKNTIVVFTSDESRERSFSGQLQNQLALNWLPLIVIHPSGAHATYDKYVGATQFPDLLVDFHTDELEEYLRTLKTDDRPVVFGNIFSRRLFWYDTEEKFLLACVTTSFVCAEYTDVADPFTMSDQQPDSVQSYPKLQSLITRADRNQLGDLD